MTGEGHHPHWPDKAMFASIMLILAGTMGTLFSLVAMLPNFTYGGTDKIPSWLRDYPGYLQFALSLATLLLGFFSLRAQRKRFTYVGCVTGIASLGFVGLVPILSLIAAGFVVQAHREGEDMTGTSPTRKYRAHEWPDKALAASLFLLVAGVLAALQGTLMLLNAFGAVLLRDVPWLEGGFDIAAGLWCAYASWQIYHLQRPWTGFVAIGLAAVSLGLYVMGPILAATALVLLLKANRENEFATA